MACTRNGSFTQVIAAHSLDDLRTKIAGRDLGRPLAARLAEPDAAGVVPSWSS